MPNQSDIRRIALSLPGVVEEENGHKYSVNGKGIAWVYRERVHPRKARVPRTDAYGIRVSGEDEKQLLLMADPDVYFTTPHYDGYPAILVWLEKIELDDLEDLLVNAWRLRAPKGTVAQYDALHPHEDDGGAEIA